LIIDDDPTLVEGLKRFSNADSYRVLASGSEQEALFLWRSEFFNLIVLNLSLPNIDGLSLLSRIKKLSADSEVVTLSDHGDIEKAIQSFRSGAFDHLVKPVEPGMIERAIKGALEKQCREFERRNALAEIVSKNMVLEGQNNILDLKVVRSDQSILRMMKSRILTRKLFEKVIQSLPFGAILIDKEGCILALFPRLEGGE
jgi:DNA-binding NtrC family response regulator